MSEEATNAKINKYGTCFGQEHEQQIELLESMLKICQQNAIQIPDPEFVPPVNIFLFYMQRAYQQFGHDKKYHEEKHPHH